MERVIKTFVTAVMAVIAIGKGAAQQVTLTLNDSTVLYGYISIQRPGRNVEFRIASTNETKTLLWSEISRIEKSESNDSSLVIIDKIILNNDSSLIGLITTQYPGRSIILRQIQSGKTVNINTNTIKASRKVRRSRDVDMWESRPYTNVMTLKSGARQDGFIVEQHYGKQPDDQYLILLTAGGYYEKIFFRDVEKYETLLRN